MGLNVVRLSYLVLDVCIAGNKSDLFSVGMEPRGQGCPLSLILYKILRTEFLDQGVHFCLLQMMCYCWPSRAMLLQVWDPVFFTGEG